MGNRDRYGAAWAIAAAADQVAGSTEVDGLRVDIWVDDGCIVVSPGGDVCMDTVPALAAVVEGLLDEGHGHLTVELSEVELLSAAGVSLLVEARQRCHRLGGSLTL